MPLQIPPTKLPRVGTTIFTVMSQLAAEHGAVNLGQGFPDFAVPQRLVDELDAAMRAGHNQYAPMTGVPVLRWPELRERAFVVSSFGKTYHCTGWKIGYAIAPAALTAEFRKVHQYNVFCTFAPAQHAFAAMIRDEPEHDEQLGAFYQAKRDRFREQLLGTRLRPLPVPGGYFQLVDYSAVSDLDDVAFCRWLTIEKGVAAIPLSPFYQSPPPGQRLIRFCFAKSDATQVAAAERLRRV